MGVAKPAKKSVAESSTKRETRSADMNAMETTTKITTTDITSTAAPIPSAMSPIAAHKVISLPELLEAILIELPLRDLIRCKRINKLFKVTIERTTSLQQKLFLRPRAKRADGLAIVNPYAQHILPYYGIACQNTEIFSSDLDKTEDGITDVTYEYCTTNKELLVPEKDYINHGIHAIDRMKLRLPLRNSHKNMLLADPPIPVVIGSWLIKKWPKPGQRTEYYQAKPEDLAITTFGELIDFFLLQIWV